MQRAPPHVRRAITLAPSTAKSAISCRVITLGSADVVLTIQKVILQNLPLCRLQRGHPFERFENMIDIRRYPWSLSPKSPDPSYLHMAIQCALCRCKGAEKENTYGYCVISST